MSAIFTALSSETETVFTTPSINYYAIAPILIMFTAAVVSVTRFVLITNFATVPVSSDKITVAVLSVPSCPVYQLNAHVAGAV